MTLGWKPSIELAVVAGKVRATSLKLLADILGRGCLPWGTQAGSAQCSAFQKEDRVSTSLFSTTCGDDVNMPSSSSAKVGVHPGLVLQALCICLPPAANALCLQAFQ